MYVCMYVAALTLDTIACAYAPTDILPIALPKIQEFLSMPSDTVGKSLCMYVCMYVYSYIHTYVEHSLVKESGMLALGALASGCLQEMSGKYFIYIYTFIHTYIFTELCTNKASYFIGHLSALFPFLISTMQVRIYVRTTYIHTYISYIHG